MGSYVWLARRVCLCLKASGHLELQHQVHAVLAERVDVVQNQRDDDVDAVTLMFRNSVLQEWMFNRLIYI